MINDPCSAKLVPGAYGQQEGYLARFKTVITPSETTTNGYILINPYSMNASLGGYFFTNIGSNASPVNTVANPLGAGTATGTGVAVTLAGDPFVATATCEAARVVSSCLRMVYVGTTSNTAGRIAYLENIDPAILLTLPSTDQMFAFASKVERTKLDPMEVTYRPAEDYDDRFKPSGVGTIDKGTAGVSATTISEEGRQLSPKWIGFAWQGIAANQFVLEHYRVLEWKPDLGVGITNDNPVSFGDGEPVVDKALSLLDNALPGWSTTLADVASSGASMLASAALAGIGLPTGPINMFGRRTPLRIMM